jgi:DNA-binding transcriptional LysR family regulator
MKHLQILEFIHAIAKTGSIRKTAESVNLTPSALNRKIQAFEREMGTEIFERLPTGVRLNAAGELLARHILNQLSEFDGLRSRIADLSGVRRGHVSIACSQAYAYHFVPEQIETYRRQFPLVTFEVRVSDHAHAVSALDAHEVDLAIIVQPPSSTSLQILVSAPQPLCAIMGADHPLARSSRLRFRDCLRYPLVLPDRSTAGRYLFDLALQRSGLQADIAISTNSFEFIRGYLVREPLIGFQIMSGLPPLGERVGLVFRQIERRDAQTVRMVVGQLRGRTLPVACAKFAEQLSRALDDPQDPSGDVDG